VPQFDPQFFATQLFWLVITFVLLYVVMAKLVLPRIADVLEDRRRRVDDNLERAQELKEEAVAVEAAYEKEVAEARLKAQTLLREATESFATEAARRNEEFAAELTEKTRVMESRIDTAREKALAGIRAVAVEVAVDATRRLAGVVVKQGKAEAAVEAAVGERG
jgi:F-type H+-transporting ATPase subunit b